MATSIPFDPNNRVYSPPLEDGDEVLSAGPFYAHNNGVTSTLCWQLTPEELEEINRTGEVWMVVRSGRRPIQPHWLGSLSEIKRQTLDIAGGIWFPPSPGKPKENS